jgi:hypothetical protein
MPTLPPSSCCAGILNRNCPPKRERCGRGTCRHICAGAARWYRGRACVLRGFLRD